MSKAEPKTGANYTIEAVDCAVDVLLAVADTADLSMAEIARKVGGSRQRIFRMVKTLESRGLIEKTRDGKSFRLGYLSLVVGNAAKAQMDLIRLAEPVMRDVGQQVDETIQLRIREAWETICVGRWEPERDIRVHAMIGRRRPLHAGSSKIFLAYLPEPEREEYLTRKLRQFTPQTVVDRDALRIRLAEIRSKGYLVSRGEVSEDLISVTAPVFATDRSVLACINISAPAARCTPSELDRWVKVVVDGAIQLSRLLGYPGAR